MKSGFWTFGERLAVPEAVMARWAMGLAGEVDLARPFFAPTGEKAECYPCTGHLACDCEHEVFRFGDGEVEAVCRCEDSDCDTIALQESDLVVYGLDMGKVCGAVRDALGFQAAGGELPVMGGVRHTWMVGRWGRLRSAVYLSARMSHQEFLLEVQKIVSVDGEPFILLTPTDLNFSALVQGLLQRQKCALVALEGTLAFGGPGRFVVKEPIGGILDRFEARVMTEGAGLRELRKELDELKERREPVEEDVARQVFALVKELEQEGRKRKAPLAQVLRLYCLEGMSAEEVARECGCAKSLVVLRLEELRKKLGRNPAELRAFSSQFESVEEALSDSRARRIYREEAIYGEEGEEM